MKVQITSKGNVIVGRTTIGMLADSCGPHGKSTGLFASCPNTTPISWALAQLGVSGVWALNMPNAGKPVPGWL